MYKRSKKNKNIYKNKFKLSSSGMTHCDRSQADNSCACSTLCIHTHMRIVNCPGRTKILSTSQWSVLHTSITHIHEHNTHTHSHTHVHIIPAHETLTVVNNATFDNTLGMGKERPGWTYIHYLPRHAHIYVRIDMCVRFLSCGSTGIYDDSCPETVRPFISRHCI